MYQYSVFFFNLLLFVISVLFLCVIHVVIRIKIMIVIINFNNYRSSEFLLAMKAAVSLHGINSISSV